MAFGEIVGIVAFRLPPSLISTAGELGLARKLVARVVVWKARGRAFDVQVGLGDWAWPSAAWLLEVHSEPGSLVSRGTLQVTVRTRYFFVSLPSIMGIRDPHVVSNRNSLPNQRPSCPDHPSGTRSP